MTILKLNDIPAGAPTVILTGDFSNVPGAITLQQKEKRIHLEHGTLGAVPLTFRTEGFEGIEVYSATETGTEYFLSFLPDGTTVPLSVTFVAGLRYQSDLREIIRNGSVPLSGPLVTSGQLADLVLDDQTTWSRIGSLTMISLRRREQIQQTRCSLPLNFSQPRYLKFTSMLILEHALATCKTYG